MTLLDFQNKSKEYDKLDTKLRDELEKYIHKFMDIIQIIYKDKLMFINLSKDIELINQTKEFKTYTHTTEPLVLNIGFSFSDRSERIIYFKYSNIKIVIAYDKKDTEYCKTISELTECYFEEATQIKDIND